MLVLSRSDVSTCLDMASAIQAMREAFTALGRGEVTMPQRLATPVDSESATHLSMPCHMAGDDPILSLKAVTFYPNNPIKGVPTTHAVVVVHDATTGEPITLMDGEILTAMRTGAVSGLATDLLAKPESSVLGAFGSGPISMWQIAAVCEVRNIQHVIVCSRDEEVGRVFCDQVSRDFGVECSFEPDNTKVAPQCDVLCLATSSLTPVLHGAEVRDGTHVNGVGSFRPDMKETDTALVAKARVVVDHLPAARAGAGEIIAAVEASVFDWAQATELADLVLGKAHGRKSSEVTFFKSVGLAVQDAATARVVLRRAQELGLGTQATLA